MLKTGIKLSLILLAFMAIPLVIFPQVFVDGFLPDIGAFDQSFIPIVKISLIWLWLAFCFDLFSWVISGVLTAGGDTRFIMIVNGIGTWIFGIGPIYYFIYIQDFSPVWINVLCGVQTVSIALMFYFRYKTKRWQKVLVN